MGQAIEAPASGMAPQAEIFRRVFRMLKPRSPVPTIVVEFRRFANANAFVRLEGDQLRVRMADVLAGAPEAVHEALAHVLLAKLYRKPVAALHLHRYRLYLSRKDVRRHLDLLRQERGRKLLVAPEGRVYNLIEIFERLNLRYFYGLMARPTLGWSRRASRSVLGHFDPCHNTIVINRVLDDHRVPGVVVEYVLYHEMLHLRFPVEHRAGRRCVHSAAFKEAESRFEGLGEARTFLKQLWGEISKDRGRAALFTEQDKS